MNENPYQNNMSNNDLNQPQMENISYGGQYAKPEKKAFAVAALVCGILSITLCACISILPALFGIIFFIVSAVKKEKGKGLRITGFILSFIGILWFGIMLIYVVVNGLPSNWNTEKTEAHFGLSSPDEAESDPFGYNTFQLSDSSMIYFEDDLSYSWYQDDAEHEDNVVYGYYEVYYGDEAADYIISELSDYGVTQSELDDFFERNSDSDSYVIDNFYCLVLHNQTAIMDGEEGEFDSTTPYMGFYADGIFDSTNMNTANYATFSLQ